MLTRWTMGGAAASVAPAAWRPALGADAGEAELRLLALSGQFLGVLVMPEPAGEVRPRGDLPPLAHPPLPDRLRPRARRVLAQLREPIARRGLLDFLDARGWTLHPADWLPRPGDDVPDVYAPWQDWTAAGSASATPEAPLTADDWDSIGPASRHVAFAALRRQDPEAARALLGEKVAGEAADHRLRLVETLAAGLSEADRPLLESLTTDRAPRVKARAASLLARLGHGETGGETGGETTGADAAELAAFFRIQTKGLVRRTRVIAPRPLKTPAQRQRRDILFDALPFDAFARAAGLPPDELLAAWPWGSDAHADLRIVAMVARSASDAIVAAMARALTAGSSIVPHLLAPLLPRLTVAERRGAAPRLLRASGSSFSLALGIAGGGADIEDVIGTQAAAMLLEALQAADAKPDAGTQDLLALGLLASREAAKRALDTLAAAGVIAADPRLDMLRMNAALDDRRPR